MVSHWRLATRSKRATARVSVLVHLRHVLGQLELGPPSPGTKLTSASSGDQVPLSSVHGRTAKGQGLSVQTSMLTFRYSHHKRFSYSYHCSVRFQLCQYSQSISRKEVM